MKNKVLTLTLLLLCCGLCLGTERAAAEEATTTTAAEPISIIPNLSDPLTASDITAGMRIVLLVIDQSTALQGVYFNGEKAKSTSKDFAAEYVYLTEDADDGKIYLKRETDGKYIKTPTAVTTQLYMTDNSSEAAQFTVTTPTTNGTGSQALASPSGNLMSNVDLTKVVRFIAQYNGSDTFLNCQDSGAAAKWHNGTGGYSVFYVRSVPSLPEGVTTLDGGLTAANDLKAGDHIALEVVSSDIQGVYFNGADAKLTTSTVTDNHLYSLVDADNSQFYLQRDADSKYVAAASGNSHNLVTMTDEQTEAAKFTLVNPTTGGTAPANFTGSGDVRTDIDETKLVRFVTSVNNAGSTTTFLNCNSSGQGAKWFSGTGGYSAYYVHRTLNADETTVVNDRISLTEAINFWDTEKPGYLNPTSITEYNTAVTALNNTSSTATDLESATTNLNNARAANLINQPKAGHYYRLTTADQKFTTAKYLYQDLTNNGVYWGNGNNAALNYYWTFDTYNDGLALQTLATGDYAKSSGVKINDNSSNENIIVNSDAVAATFSVGNVPGAVCIALDGKNIHMLNHNSGKGTGGNVIYWSSADATKDASTYYITEVDAATVAANIGAPVTDLNDIDATAVTSYLRAIHEDTRVSSAHPYSAAVGTGYNEYSTDAEEAPSLEDIQKTFSDYSTKSTALRALTKSDITNGTSTLNECITAARNILSTVPTLTINLPKDGDFLRIASANETKVYLGGKNHSTQTGSAAYVSTSDNTTTVFFYNGGKLENYNNGYHLIQNGVYVKYGSTCADGTPISDFTFQAAKTGTVGQYNIQFATNRSLYAQPDGYTDSGSDITSSTTDVGYRFTLEKVNALDVTVSDAGYATFYAPVDVNVPTGLTAYTGEVDETGEYLTLTAVATIPALTGAILKGAANTYSLPIVEGTYQATAAAADDATTTLSGTVATIQSTTVTETLYTLQMRDNEVGLFPFGNSDSEDTTTPELKGFKAFLPLTSSSAVRGFIFNDDATVTALHTVSTDAPEADAIYDLSGRRILTPATRGIYIANGKKVYIR